MLLLVNKFKMIGMLLNVVHGQVQKSEQKHITKESNGFHNHSMIKMNVNELRNTSLHSPSPPPPIAIVIIIIIITIITME